MSFVYPRVVAITRPNVQTAVGAVGYSGLQASNEAAIASGLPASIQLNKQSGREDADLPGDSARTLWKILIPASAIALGQIQTRDIVTDELGTRYQVAGPYWNSLGHNLLCQLLET